MKLPGYCTGCNRPRTVDCGVFMPSQIPLGVCDECQDAQDKPAIQARRNSQSRLWYDAPAGMTPDEARRQNRELGWLKYRERR